MAGIQGTRVDYDTQSQSSGSKANKGDQRVDTRKTGGLAGTEQARAQKPVSKVTNANTVATSDATPKARPTTGYSGK